jgi:hypothetical protein
MHLRTGATLLLRKKEIMITNKKLSIAAAALTGLLAGSASRVMASPVSHNGSSSQQIGQRATTLDDAPADKHSCKGQNACKGQGGCKTSDNGCKSKNSCKGKGGCKSADDSTPAPAKLVRVG